MKRVIIVAVAAIVPSVFLAADIVKDSVFQSNVSNYIETEFRFDNTQVVKYEVNEESKELKVAVIGATLNDAVIEKLQQSMEEYHIENLSLNVQQTVVKAGITSEELEAYVKNETSQLNAANEEDYQELQSQLIAVKSELSEYQSREVDVEALQEEIIALYPKVTAVHAGYLKDSSEEQMAVILEVKEPLSENNMKTLEKWIGKRLEVEKTVVYQSMDNILYPAGMEKEMEKDETEDNGTGENAAQQADEAEEPTES